MDTPTLVSVGAMVAKILAAWLAVDVVIVGLWCLALRVGQRRGRRA